MTAELTGGQGQYPLWTTAPDPAAGSVPGRPVSRTAARCSHPVALVGRTDTVDTSTGEVVGSLSSDGFASGRLLVACGDRRAAVCPACSRTYRGDTWALVRLGLAGGRMVPAGVAGHPAVFATFTPPGFGPVHTRQVGRDGRAVACRARRELPVCEHGRPASCPVRHGPDDPAVGQPLCPACYDYPGAVLWQAHAGRLWDRTVLAVRRGLAGELGVPVTRLAAVARVAFVRVAEFQRRGLVHLHTVIRLDGPTGPADPPPDTATVGVLEAAVRAAHARVAVGVPYSRAYGELDVRWGRQLDVQPIPADDAVPGEVSADGSRSVLGRRGVASYLAKYATKSTHDVGMVLVGPVRRPSDLDGPRISPHARAMAAACWWLGGQREYAHLRLRAWAHSLGWRGHPSSKSRAYSTTLTALRAARTQYGQQPSHPGDSRPQGVQLAAEGDWRYAGRGRPPGAVWGGDDRGG